MTYVNKFFHTDLCKLPCSKNITSISGFYEITTIFFTFLTLVGKLAARMNLKFVYSGDLDSENTDFEQVSHIQKPIIENSYNEKTMNNRSTVENFINIHRVKSHKQLLPFLPSQEQAEGVSPGYAEVTILSIIFTKSNKYRPVLLQLLPFTSRTQGCLIQVC